MNKAKMYITSSILIVGVYMFGVALLTPNITGETTLIENIIHFWIPTILIINAVIVTPTIMRRKLNDETRKLFVKRLVKISSTLFLLGMIYIHVAVPFYWSHYIVWILNIFASFIFVVVTGISKTIDKEKGSTIFLNYILPFFTIALIIWSYFIILATVIEVR